MRISRRRTHRLLVAGLLFAIVVGLRVWVARVGPLPGDRAGLARYLPADPHAAANQIDELFSVLGSAPAAAVTVFVGVVALARRRGPEAAAGLVLALGVVLVVAGLKAAWGPTPLWRSLRPHHGANYPSGHTAYATSVFGYLCLSLRRREDIEWLGLGWLGIVGIGPALAISGAHLVSDVVGGYLLGAAWLALVTAFVSPRPTPDAHGAKNGAEM